MEQILSFIDICGSGNYTIKHVKCNSSDKEKINQLIESTPECYKEYLDSEYISCSKYIFFF